jgi:hypothetical protein
MITHVISAQKNYWKCTIKYLKKTYLRLRLSDDLLWLVFVIAFALPIEIVISISIFDSVISMISKIIIDAHGLKIWGRVHEVFVQFREGGSIGIVKIWGEGTHLWCFIAFLLTSFAKI